MRCRTLIAMVCLLAVSSWVAVTADAAQPSRRGERRANRKPAPKRGERAPFLKLRKLESKDTVDLAEVIKDKPVILFFGSYT